MGRKLILLKRERENAGQPGMYAGRKGTIPFDRLLLGIVCLVLIGLFSAVLTGTLDMSGILRDDEGACLAGEDNALAALARGFLHYHGLGVPQNLGYAFSQFSEAANKGDADGQFHVGIMLSRGEGVTRNMEMACSWLRKAALQGHADAWIALGELYAGGVEGSPQDKAKTADWLRKAAGEGNDKAQAALKALEEDMAGDALPETEQLARAYACLEGKGVPKDMDAAARWFRKAAAKGNVDAQWRSPP